MTFNLPGLQVQANPGEPSKAVQTPLRQGSGMQLLGLGVGRTTDAEFCKSIHDTTKGFK